VVLPGSKLTSLEHLAERCRTAGIKATPQRLEIFRALVDSHAHPTPEEIYRWVKDRMPTVSLATIYKTLDALEGAGLARLVSHTGDTKRYDGNLTPHHHLVCSACGKIADFSDPALESFALPAELEGFQPERVSVQVVGLCKSCLDSVEDDTH